MTSKDRAEIVRIIAENQSQFSHEHCEALFHLTAEDLIAGGIDPVRVRSAMIRSWTRLQQAEIGTPGVVELLRDLSDAIERHLLANSQQWSN